MNFVSIEYLVFLAIVWLAYLALPLRGQNLLLLAASYYFYAQWDWRFLSLIWISTLANYLAGRVIAASSRPRIRHLALVTAMVVNLVLLGFFKYFNFFVDSAAAATDALGLSLPLSTLSIILPIGISFYTFQTMSYTIDVYRGVMPETRSLVNFSLFVAFFPQLVAGPIERAKHLLPILESRRTLATDEIVRGLFLILLGMVKKLAIADGLSRSVDAIYGSSQDLSGGDVLLATYAFAFQILCDFSAYTDIARGTAKLFGIDLMINFDAPFFARSPSEFWRRWHISLSTWLRDYLYIPLGGNRASRWLTFRNLSLTMILGGLWHGAAWNFVIWGAYHGAILCLFRVLHRSRPAPEPTDPNPQPPRTLRHNLGVAIGIAAFFQMTCYGWLLFRAESFEQIVRFTTLIITPDGWTALSIPRPPLSALAGLVFLVAWEGLTYRHGNASFYRDWHPLLRGALIGLLLILLAMGMSNESATFIYFQF
ncbi:MBOAT family O-acyltransferase [Mucisphaera calidilacus]|uniref:Peptidoglycan O-acetyltransferase n=1 Tax=Mucisphaera calidilacus TaxID=2527982 RepID=A0A518C0F2_9BACT|nr:MBOAT family O-acyltransferase [Mucisphaera calidilacus]QDU72708.1 Peptidoglycan O-acetyltransferase [Mucisphaera calidilacus]